MYVIAQSGLTVEPIIDRDNKLPQDNQEKAYEFRHNTFNCISSDFAGGNTNLASQQKLGLWSKRRCWISGSYTVNHATNGKDLTM
jgi:hypothetical protein